MRFRNGLALIERTSKRGGWNLASYHSPHSMTWRWILSLDLPRRGEGRWLHFSRSPGLGQQKWILQVAKFGLRWLTQRPMWYRDLYARLSDERAIAEGRMWRGSAYQAPPPLPPITPESTSTH